MNERQMIIMVPNGTSSRTYRDDEPLLVRRAKAVLKSGIRAVAPVPPGRRHVLLVFGCQRSGTTMLQQSLLDHSWRTILLEEHDRRLTANDPERLRWDDLDLISKRILRLPFELVVAKPLAESHRSVELLDSLGEAKGIWMLRHFLSVANSNLTRFGKDNGYRDLQILVEKWASDWRGTGSEQVRRQVADLLPTGLSPLDAAAVFWWARNKLYVDQALWHEERIKVLRYESLLANPNECLRALSKFIGIEFPVRTMARSVRSATAVKGELRPDVGRLCSELFAEFEGAPSISVLFGCGNFCGRSQRIQPGRMVLCPACSDRQLRLLLL